MMADYLRAQARLCSQWARECFDLGTAARLRSMADEFKARAAEIETSTFEIALEHPASPRRPTALEIGDDAP